LSGGHFVKTEENFERFAEFANTPSQNRSHSKKSQRQVISSNRAVNSFCKQEFEIEDKHNPGLTTPSKRPKFFELGGEAARKTIEKSIEPFTGQKLLNSPRLLCKFEESPSRFHKIPLYYIRVYFLIRMLNLCTPEAQERKFFLRTSSSRKQTLSMKKGLIMLPSLMEDEKENETPNFSGRKYGFFIRKKIIFLKSLRNIYDLTDKFMN